MYSIFWEWTLTFKLKILALVIAICWGRLMNETFIMKALSMAKRYPMLAIESLERPLIGALTETLPVWKFQILPNAIV